MKKLLMSVAALAAVVVLNSCGDGKVPTITLPTDASKPVFDLGDVEAALEDVKIKDATKDTIIEGIDYVGDQELIYKASNESGTAKELRAAIVKVDKLLGNYTANYTGPTAEKPSGNPEAVLIQGEYIKLNIKNLDENSVITAVGDGTDELKITDNTFDAGLDYEYHVSGTIKYAPVDATKKKYEFLTGKLDYTYPNHPELNGSTTITFSKL
ncbi:MAG: hypothetical protein LBR36_07170 [Bacteroidales bacterium]|jgi:hypothetical protein|nr:hypothetical protein [Bacteroidales bacterium]